MKADALADLLAALQKENEQAVSAPPPRTADTSTVNQSAVQNNTTADLDASTASASQQHDTSAVSLNQSYYPEVLASVTSTVPLAKPSASIPPSLDNSAVHAKSAAPSLNTSVAHEPPPAPAARAPSPPPAPAPSVPPTGIVLRVLSCWGESGEVGLTELELLDESGRRIKLQPGSVQLAGCSRPLTWAQKEQLARLTDGECRTTDPNHMFLLRKGPQDTYVDFIVAEPPESDPVALSVWNYNKSFVDSAKGVKEVEVFRDGAPVWKGTIARAAGNPIDTNHHMRILLDPKRVLKQANSKIEAGLVRTSLALTPLAEESEHVASPVKPLRSSLALHSSASPAKPDPLDELLRNAGVLSESNAPSTSYSGGPGASRITSGRRAGVIREAAASVEPSSLLAEDPKPVRRRAGQERDANFHALPLLDEETENVAPVPSDAPLIDGEDGPKFGRRRRPLMSTEESLRSIAQFDRSHMGRLGGLDGDATRAADDSVLNLTAADYSHEASQLHLDLDQSQAEDHHFHHRAPPPVPAGAPAAHQGAASVSHSRIVEHDDEPDAISQLLKAPAASAAPPAQNQIDTSLGVSAIEEQKPSALDGFSILDETAEPASSSYLSQLVDGALKAAAARPEPEPEAPAAAAAPAPKLASGCGPTYAEVFGSSEAFRIPETPSGAIIEVVLHSTWGDVHYIGLNGIEIFDHEGRAITIADPYEQVSASPDSVNVLPGHPGDDPRTPDKLFDGIHMTCDDLHCWLAPFTAGQRHAISIDLGEAVKLGCIRFWNLNKSRVHSSRGARLVEVFLDGAPIFRGEIARAPGTIQDAPFFSETVLFTEDPVALAEIEGYDERYRVALVGLETERSVINLDEEESESDVFPTNLPEVVGDSEHSSASGTPHNLMLSDRPVTAAKPQPAPSAVIKALSSKPSPVSTTPTSPTGSTKAAPQLQIPSSSPPHYPKGVEVVLEILESFGDKWYVGLAGLEFIGPGGQEVEQPASVTAFPSDVNLLAQLGLTGGAGNDPRTVQNLLNGVNNTVDDSQMWLTPSSAWLDLTTAPRPQVPLGISNAKASWVRFTFHEPTTLGGIRFWNYNKSNEDSARGVKRLRVYVNGKLACSPSGVVLRRGPGHGRYNFGQFVALTAGGGTPIVSPTHHAKPSDVREEASRAWLEALIGDDVSRYEQELRRAQTQGAGELHAIQPSFDVPVLPSGFTLQFIIRSTHGDEHFVGLTGIEVHDAVLGPLPTSMFHVDVAPASAVRELPGMQADCRTPDKLLDGVNSGAPKHTWLAPIVKDGSVGHSRRSVILHQAVPGAGPEYERGALSLISLCCDRPLLLSCIRIWNYGPRHVDRGACEVDVYLDGFNVFSGRLRKAHGSGPPQAQAILFSPSPALIKMFKDEVFTPEGEETEQSILCLDEDGDGDSAAQVQQQESLVTAKMKSLGYSAPRPNTAVVV